MVLDFTNKMVIITGAAIGIGKATAIEFAKSHANICLVDVDEMRLNEVRDEVSKIGAKVISFVADIADEIQVQNVVDNCINTFGKIDILINNAGLWREFVPFVDTTPKDWKRLINVNIIGTFNFSHAVLNNMIENKYGRIINLGSVAGVYGNARMTVYSTTKGALASFTKALAKEVAEFGITVNNVVPGNVLNEGSIDNQNLSYIPRSGRLQEFAYLICFLASDKASYISGQDHLIDGCRKKV